MYARKLAFGLATTAAFLAFLAAWGPALADDEPAPEAPAEREELTDHPLKDAKPGEFLRFVKEADGWKTYFVERVLAVKEDQLLFEIYQTNKDGKDITKLQGGWIDIPEFKPSEHQRILSDEMVEVEVAGQTLWCRHLYIEQPENPPMPVPKIRRDVWYSNDVPCSGKVKEIPGGRIVTEWGAMPAEELAKRKKAYEPKEGDGDRRVPTE